MKIMFAFFTIFSILFFITPRIKAAENSNLAALLAIDTLKDNAVLKDDTINISGWSLNNSGVKQVQISMDGGNAQNATIGQARADVNKAFPGYEGGANSGYCYSLDISSITTGLHTITVKSFGNDGTSKSQSLTIYKVPKDGKNMQQLLSIDAPNASTMLNGASTSINVNGWSLNGYGVQKVQVYFDNIEKDAAIGQARTDVDKAFSGYIGGINSGYSCSVDLPKVSDGIHVVKVVSIGNDGLVASKSINVKKVSANNMPGIISIDTPANNSKVLGDTANIAGWSLNQSGVKQVQISVDNGSTQNALIGLSRPDVNRIYSNYTESANSGYNYSLNMNSLSIGLHKITVTSIGNDGSVATKDVTIYKVPKNSSIKVPLMSIDTPDSSTLLKDRDNQLTVSGWSLNGYGVQKVQVYIDNIEKDATIGEARADVDKIIPGYFGGTTSGYSCTLDISQISDGVHIIKVVSIGNDGSTTSQSVNIKRVSEKSMPGIVSIDTPNYLQISDKELHVSGWSLDLYGVKQVEVALDNGIIKDASIGGIRTDVAKAYPGYLNGGSSGFNCILDISSLSSGIHTLKVTSTGDDGTQAINSTKIYVLAAGQSTLPNRISIDTPQNNVGIKAQNYLFNVSGWSLNAFGVKEVQIYVDNKIYGKAQLGISRPDVNNEFSGYTEGSQSGYLCTVNTYSLSYGAHIITVKSIGNDNSIISQDVVIYKVPNNTDLAARLVSFLSTGNNVQQTENQAVSLHYGDQTNNCVYFSSTALRSIGINVPIWMENTKHYVPYITSLGWTRTSDVNQLYPGNICFTVPDGSGYPTHTYVFMGWVDPNDHTKAYVADNQANTIHIRSMVDAPGIDAFNFAFFN